MAKTYSITLDGPGGSGKTTIAKRLAKTLNITYLDTGAMYRAVAYYMINNNIDVDDESAVKEHLNEISIEVKDEDVQVVLLNGEDIAGKIRTPEMSMGALAVSKHPSVRMKLVELQRAIARNTTMVIDGRDIGSFVLPEAEYKFYITADVDVRAKRRYLELKEKGQKVTLKDVKEQMIERDKQDEAKALAPLCIPQGAYVIDTSNLSIDEVIEIILNKVKK